MFNPQNSKNIMVNPNYLIRVSAKEKEPFMFACYSENLSEAFESASQCMNQIEYDEAEIWAFYGKTLVGKCVRNEENGGLKREWMKN